MKTQRIKALIVTGVVVVGGLGIGIWTTHDNTPVQTAKKPAAVQQAKQTKATDHISYKGAEGKNALELLKTHATVVTKDSSYGPYVVSINGLDGGSSGKYWTFYVNGQMSSVGANDYATKAGDSIEWKLQ
jgi:hypothetical protein